MRHPPPIHAMTTLATIRITLAGFPSQDSLPWVQEHLFTAALRYRTWVEGLGSASIDPASASAIERINEENRMSLAFARDSLRLSRIGPDLEMNFGLRYEGSMERSEDGRMLWLRNDFENRVWTHLRAALLRNTRCLLLNDSPPDDEDVAKLLPWIDALDLAMAGANDAKCPAFKIDLEPMPA